MVRLLSYMQSRLSVPRIVGFAAVLVAAITAFAGASLVSAQRGEPGEPPTIENFQGCVNNHTGMLRIIAEYGQCAEHETPINLDGGAGNDDLLARIEALEQQTVDQQSEIDALTQQNTDQQTAIDNLTTANQTQQMTIDDLTSENQTQQTAIDSLTMENQSQQTTINDLTTANQAQQTTITNLTTENQNQQGEIDALELRVDTLESNPVTLPACMTTEAVEGQANDDIVFNGCNVHVLNGNGGTGTVNGTGNLIIGYDEDDGDTKTGSHNLVIGAYHTYSNYGGLVAGDNNAITGPYNSITGGSGNTTSNNHSSISGGHQNTASGKQSSVSGGAVNTASGDWSSISGGDRNTASGRNSNITGGSDNVASGGFSSVSGGESNTAAGDFSTIGGGASETVDGDYDWRAGDLYFTEE